MNNYIQNIKHNLRNSKKKKHFNRYINNSHIKYKSVYIFETAINYVFNE